MFFSLRTKLLAMLLLVSLIAALAVTATAYWMLMQDFNDRVREQAFRHFQADVEDYIGAHGSWANAQRALSFTEFVVRRRSGSEGFPATIAAGGQIPLRPPPFHFLLTDPHGTTLLAPAGYREGQRVETVELRKARAIHVNGELAALAVPVGKAQLSAQDQAYLDALRNALLNGMLAALALALALGLLLGSRFSARIRELTAAIGSMRADGELPQQVAVHSRDEMGQLAEAFNRMSSELAAAHAAAQATAAQVQSQSAQLKELSIRDPLTELFNRRYFDEHAAQLYQLAVRSGRPLCMAVGDLDFFKVVNDTLSHAVGDEVLRCIARLMRENIRRSDLLARYGGEEFVIALVDSTAEEAAACCEKLRLGIAHYPWHEVHPNLRVTISIGLCDDISLRSMDEMLHAADSALYEAKRSGRNRVVRSLPVRKA